MDMSSVNTSGFFNDLFIHSKVNAVLVMNDTGIILGINPVFTASFGYTEEDIVNRHFSLLFTEADKKLNKPEMELIALKQTRQSNDDNYVVHKNGSCIWVTGESILERESGIVFKIIHNIQVQKLLEQFLTDSNEFIDTLFDSVKHEGLVVLDTEMRIVKVNAAFLTLFAIEEQNVQGARLWALSKYFANTAIRQAITGIVTERKQLNNELINDADTSVNIQFLFTSKIIRGKSDGDRKILLVIRKQYLPGS